MQHERKFFLRAFKVNGQFSFKANATCSYKHSPQLYAFAGFSVKLLRRDTSIGGRMIILNCRSVKYFSRDA